MRTDKKCHICQEDFNDDWECSTLCVHDGCLEKVFQNTSKTYISAVQQRGEFRTALKERNAEIARLREAIEKTIAENLHLADGENCTLILLKRALL